MTRYGVVQSASKTEQARDSRITATAITRNATLVHKDPEFDAQADIVTR